MICVKDPLVVRTLRSDGLEQDYYGANEFGPGVWLGNCPDKQLQSLSFIPHVLDNMVHVEL